MQSFQSNILIYLLLFFFFHTKDDWLPIQTEILSPTLGRTQSLWWDELLTAYYIQFRHSWQMNSFKIWASSFGLSTFTSCPEWSIMQNWTFSIFSEILSATFLFTWSCFPQRIKTGQEIFASLSVKSRLYGKSCGIIYKSSWSITTHVN